MGQLSPRHNLPLPAASRPDQLRKKRFHNKTKSGCDGCKARRVKCPEQRPVCQRCQQANRACTYTETKANIFEPSWVHVTTSTPSTALTSPGAQGDKRAFQFYLERTIPGLTAYSDLTRAFWGVYIPQLANSESSVRHLAIALATRQEKTTTTSASALNRLQLTEREHYTSSLSSLTHGSTIADVEVLLVASAGFIAYGNLEPYEKQTAQDLLHFSSAIKILNERARSAQKRGSEIIDQVVAPMLARLELMFSVWMEPQDMTGYEVTLKPAKPILPQQFSSIDQARQSFVDIVCYRQHHSIRQQPWNFQSAGFIAIRKLLLDWNNLVLASNGHMGGESELGQQRIAMMLAQFRLLFTGFIYSVRTDLHIEDHLRPTTITLVKHGQMSLTYDLPQRYLQLLPGLDWESQKYQDPLQVRLWPLTQVTSVTERSASITMTFYI